MPGASPKRHLHPTQYPWEVPGRKSPSKGVNQESKGDSLKKTNYIQKSREEGLAHDGGGRVQKLDVL
jgi:hypothetical protein